MFFIEQQRIKTCYAYFNKQERRGIGLLHIRPHKCGFSIEILTFGQASKLLKHELTILKSSLREKLKNRYSNRVQ